MLPRSYTYVTTMLSYYHVCCTYSYTYVGRSHEGNVFHTCKKNVYKQISLLFNIKLQCMEPEW